VKKVSKSTAIEGHTIVECKLDKKDYERLGNAELNVGIVMRGKFADLLLLMDVVENLSDDSTFEIVHKRYSVGHLHIEE